MRIWKQISYITTRYRQHRDSFEKSIGTADAISIEFGFKSLENKLEGLISEDQVNALNTGEKGINHACLLESKHPTVPPPINITVGKSNGQCEFRFENLAQNTFVHVNSLLPIPLGVGYNGRKR